MHSRLSAPATAPSRVIERAVEQVEQRHRAWLHDTVLQVLEYLATGGYGECVEPDRLMHVAARAADELRDVLDSDTFDIEHSDFRTALRAVVEEASQLSGIDVRLDLEDFEDFVHPDMGAEVVCVVREALNNTRKHSGARTARIACFTHQGHLEVHVVDDGHGFDPRTVSEGLGMRCSMRERMARCGGYVAIASAPGRGVMVRITGRLDGARVREHVA